MAQLVERVGNMSFFHAGDPGSIPGLTKYFNFILFLKFFSMICTKFGFVWRYIELFHRKCLNIVLVSRSPYKLQNVAAELEQKYSGIKTK